MQAVAAAPAVLVFGADADYAQRAFAKQNGLADGVGAFREQLFAGVRIDNHHLRGSVYVVLVKQPALVKLDTAHVEILLARAVELGGNVGVAVGNGGAGSGHRGHAIHIALFADGFGIGNGERADTAPVAVAEAFTGIHADGVGADGADVGKDFLLRAAPQRHHGYHRCNADNNAEHGEQGAHFVRHNGLHRHFEGFHKLVFIKQPRCLFGAAFHAAGRDFGVFAGVGDDFAVFDFNHTVGKGGDFRIMRYQNNGMSFGMQPADDFHHHLAAAGIERAGGLVGQDDFAAVHQRAGNGHALLLAAGELVGAVVFFAFQAQISQKLSSAFIPLFLIHAGIHGGQRHVFARAQCAQQVVALENKAEFAPAQRGQLVAAHLRSFHAVDLIRAGSGTIETADDVHQRGFAGAGLADDGNEIAFLNGEADVF